MLELKQGETVFEWIRRLQEATKEAERAAEFQAILRKWYLRIEQQRFKAKPQAINLESE